MMRVFQRALPAILLILLAACHTSFAKGQAAYAGFGPGSYVSVGVTASGYNSDYGKQRLAGPAIYLDANLYRRIGVELEARSLRYNAQENLRETTYLAGPKISTHGRTLRPYGKLLVGRGEFNYPFNYAKGSYFVVAPGGGIDWRLGRSRIIFRIADVEYQFWPRFSYGPLHPWGVSSGLALRLF